MFWDYFDQLLLFVGRYDGSFLLKKTAIILNLCLELWFFCLLLTFSMGSLIVPASAVE
jgi:hypothetical protein